ncbi:hypothetical protein WDW86_20835, partial [Bdellovibrionota bacterium FG-2]
DPTDPAPIAPPPAQSYLEKGTKNRQSKALHGGLHFYALVIHQRSGRIHDANNIRRKLSKLGETFLNLRLVSILL